MLTDRDLDILRQSWRIEDKTCKKIACDLIYKKQADPDDFFVLEMMTFIQKHYFEKGSPDQPRVPAGQSGGGQWTSEEGNDTSTEQPDGSFDVAAGDGTPRTNGPQNKQIDDICSKLKLTKDQRKELHDRIHGENMGYIEILKEAKDMFCK